MLLRLAIPSLLLLSSCGLWRTEKDVQRDYAKSLRPATVAPEDPVPSAPVRSLRVRVYAEREYRAQTLRWRQRIQEQLARANRVLEAQFGARLDVVDLREWESTDRMGELSGALGELLALDHATDVDWVIGFISSLPVFSTSQEQLGVAPLFGRHIVLRGMDSLAESQQARSALDRLSEAEREDLLRERSMHRQTLVLLHEWAHTLGAFHERASEGIMAPFYDASQSGFSPVSREIIAVGLRSRVPQEQGPRVAWGKAYRGLVEKHAAAAWDADTREDALNASLALLGTDSGTGEASPSARRESIEPARSGSAGSPCETAVRRARLDPSTIETCRAAAADPGAPLELVLAVPQLLIERKDLLAARQATAEAEAVVAARNGGSPYWARVAQLYAEIEACSDAERAASRLPDANATRAQILADCTRTRRRAGLRRGGGVPVEREPAYVELVSQAQRDVEQRMYRRADQRAADLARTYPAAPGAQIVRCLVQAKTKAPATARNTCAAAAAADDDAVIPQWMLGAMAADQGRWDEAHVRLWRALDLDDSRGEVWTRLANVEQRRGDIKAFATLRARHRARFGLELRER